MIRQFGSLVLCAALLTALPPAAAGAEPGQQVPLFTVKLLDGKLVRNRDLKGKVTVIDFWATWCGPCIAEIGDYNRFYRDYSPKGVRFMGLAADSGTEAELRGAVKQLGIGYPVAAVTWDDLDVFGDIAVFPTTWIVDARGKVAKVFFGAPADKHTVLRATVDRLLKEAAK